jgi:hypothetical protein
MRHLAVDQVLLNSICRLLRAKNEVRLKGLRFCSRQSKSNWSRILSSSDRFLRLNMFDATVISCDKASAASEFLIPRVWSADSSCIECESPLEESQFGELEG